LSVLTNSNKPIHWFFKGFSRMEQWPDG
jgi:hypothetical protein